MNINQVRFGYAISNAKVDTNKTDKNDKQEKNVAEQQTTKSVYSADNVLSALNLAGVVNQVAINKAGAKEVNPSDYLSNDRINDIEAAMAEFENGVGNIADIIDDEFGDFFSEAQKNALAASIYSQE